jgi:hypothetical protein
MGFQWYSNWIRFHIQRISPPVTRALGFAPALWFVPSNAWITTPGEKISLWMNSEHYGRSVAHPLATRRGRAAVVEVYVVRCDRATSWPFHHIVASHSSSLVTVVAPQPVNTTVDRRGDSSPLLGRQHDFSKLGATADGPYKSMPSELH